jgi:hypothetical protein
VIDVSNETNSLEEGCLSYPHLFVKIKRPSIVKVRFQDAFGEMHTEKFVGMTARAFQHEVDHMDGVRYQTRANRIHLDRALNQQKILTRRLKRGEVTIKPNAVMTEGQLRDVQKEQLTLKTTDRVMDIATDIKL